MEKTKAICYIRVSSKKQVEDGSSLETQEATIRKYADLNDLDITDVYADRGVSASTGKRPGFEHVMQLVKDGKIKAIVVYSISRFARNTKTLLESIEIMKKHGVAFHSFKERIDTDSAMGEFFITVIGALAQLESKTIGERVYDAKSHNKDNGRTYSTPIFGFDNDKVNHLLVPNEEMIMVKHIHALHCTGASFGAIADKLNEQGVATKKGGKWHRSTISNIINNQVYSKI